MNILSELWYMLHDEDTPIDISEVVDALWEKDKKPQLNKTRKTALGYDFYFCLPAGISFRDFAAKKEYFRDAIGLHSTVDFIHTGKMALLRVVTSVLKDKYLYDWQYDRNGGNLVIPIGYTHTGLITIALETIPHILVGGITGGGKSNAIHVIVNSLLHAPVKPQIVLVDLKKSEYNYLENHCLIITEPDTADQALSKLVAEMRKRQDIFKTAKCVNIAKYNAKHDPLPYIVLVIDELAELTDEDTQDKVETLLRLCRSSGICIIAATQRPDANTFKKFGQSKANFRGRLCFQVADAINSKIILDNAMGADLPDTAGRAIWKLGKDCIELQTPYLDPEEAEKKLP